LHLGAEGRLRIALDLVVAHADEGVEGTSPAP
jgi:hypothetical protein